MTTPSEASPDRRSELLPIREACERLGIGESTLYRALNAGQVPGGRRLGGRWIIARAVFERWLVDGVEPGDADAPDDADASAPGSPFLRHVDRFDRKAAS